MELNTSVPRLEGKTATTGKSCGYILDGNSSLVLVAAVSQQGLRVELPTRAQTGDVPLRHTGGQKC